MATESSAAESATASAREALAPASSGERRQGGRESIGLSERSSWTRH